MGACGSTMSPEDEDNAKQSRNIDKENATDAMKQETVIKLLLLGAGEFTVS